MTSQQITRDITNSIVYSDDKNLVQLAGQEAYKKPKRDIELYVNDVEFIVVDTHYGDPTGLDSLMVVNTDTDEVSIVYVGTDAGADNGKQDLLTDAQLLSDLTLPQLEAAQEYYNKMNKKYESLGGVKSVTLNAALLPKGMADPDKSYDNITNYFTNYDVLTGTLIALNLDSRIPGKRYDISTGIPEIGEGFNILKNNHTGYTEDGKYEIGQPGSPGHGYIYDEADAHIMTSIWTGEPLYDGHSDRIEINRDNLNLLAEAMGGDVLTRLRQAQEYLTHSEWKRGDGSLASFLEAEEPSPCFPKNF
ncbi:hypothetical protein H7H33_21235 [Rossellomorea vietnamensis]|nr:hypothetical protein [Rossellomorea vietnamensis]MCC5804330.1 hypothetical protein [Rossellomorea vietnamensis]